MHSSAPLYVALASSLSQVGTALGTSPTDITTTIYPGANPSTVSSYDLGGFWSSFLSGLGTDHGSSHTTGAPASTALGTVTLSEALSTESISNLVTSGGGPSLTTTLAFSNPTGAAVAGAGQPGGGVVMGLAGAVVVAGVFV
ncbi:uncharacterized protein B0I36DRAFT_338522 [Microdochium trichocladiopsis]|uniref:Uncharacterized protein n=1 Tax=Microdochium trichocladiopsis TaxID=1682393 RepID=A0A9P9BIF5_9PEZI|nr:uncharacterized protein B0I36DRAFT_338522 [Microdochium trichocladiopsis]KAH7014310.1 hypothetical protein B0I36DRAFT_338522 [Microdochium trichocladiopsis]